MRDMREILLVIVHGLGHPQRSVGNCLQGSTSFNWRDLMNLEMTPLENTSCELVATIAHQPVWSNGAMRPTTIATAALEQLIAVGVKVHDHAMWEILIGHGQKIVMIGGRTLIVAIHPSGWHPLHLVIHSK